VRQPRRWASEAEFLHELELLRMERELRAKSEAWRINEHLRLGIASADELRVAFPSRIGKIPER
jgi:hypothetical protein